MERTLSRQKVYIGMGGWELEPYNKFFYPPNPKKGFRKLEFYCQFFDSVEVNATFYNTSFTRENVKRWLDDVAANKEFMFTVKLYRGFTHTFDATLADARAVHHLLEPFVEAGKLGGLLMQFPYRFTNLPERRRYIVQLSKIFAQYRLFLEVRHNSWNNPSIYDFFKDNKLHPVNVDLPPIKRHMPLTSLTWGGVAYFRMMGRNCETWDHPWYWRPPQPYIISDRYNYLYSEREIKSLVDVITKLKAQTAFVVFHNDPEASSLVNGFQIRHLLRNRRRVLIPDRLVYKFPLLTKISHSVNLSHPLFSGIN
jgi:uncharacterized protein YecE (DUF72 family)